MVEFCGASCPELDKPPSRTNMGFLQIIELIIMGVVGILCFIDLYYMIKAGSGPWTILGIIVDGLIVGGLCCIIYGLFADRCLLPQLSRCAYTSIYCFFAGTIVQVVCIVYFMIKSPGTIENWLINLIKVVILVFLAYVLWRQSANV